RCEHRLLCFRVADDPPRAGSDASLNANSRGPRGQRHFQPKLTYTSVEVPANELAFSKSTRHRAMMTRHAAKTAAHGPTGELLWCLTHAVSSGVMRVSSNSRLGKAAEGGRMGRKRWSTAYKDLRGRWKDNS